MKVEPETQCPLKQVIWKQKFMQTDVFKAYFRML